MRRKVIKHGAATLTISLPLKWARDNNVKKGDELIVEGRKNELVVRVEKSKSAPEKKEIDIGNLSRLGVGYMIGSYRDGFDEIDLRYKNANYITKIQETLANELEGFEIVRQGKNSCTIKDLLGIEKGDLDVAMRRLWVLLLSISEDVLSAIKNDDRVTLENIIPRDASINRFTNYCVRIIMKKGIEIPRNSCAYYFLVTILEEISDQYKEISKYFLDHDRKLTKETEEIFSTINSYLRELYRLVYKFDKEKTEKVFTGTKQTPKKIKTLMEAKSPDTVTLGNLLNISEQIRSLLSINVEIQIK